MDGIFGNKIYQHESLKFRVYEDLAIHLVWANENALYLNKQLTTTNLSGTPFGKHNY